MLGRLFDHCESDHDTDTLVEIALRAGILWRCTDCGYDNDEDETCCAACSTDKEITLCDA